jgi:hypothetical protein
LFLRVILVCYCHFRIFILYSTFQYFVLQSSEYAKKSYTHTLNSVYYPVRQSRPHLHYNLHT